MATDPTFDDPNVIAIHAARRAERHGAGRKTDFVVTEGARLDDRTRAGMDRTVAAIVGPIEREIRRDAARLLTERGDAAAADRLMAASGDVLELIARSNLPGELVAELLGRVPHDLLAEALPVAVGEPDAPSLLVRLTTVPDAAVADAAAALLLAENRRLDPNGDPDSGLAARVHERLAWLVAAGLRTILSASLIVDAALTEAAQRAIAAHGERQRSESAALRLAMAIDARPGELAGLLVEALGDRRLSLFVAVLARALGYEMATTRALIIEPDDERLWLALRAIALDRASIARVALALSDADPRRDIEALADRLDEIVAVAPADARAALAPLMLPAGFRAAIRAIGR